MVRKSYLLLLIGLCLDGQLALTGLALGDDALTLHPDRLQWATSTFETTCALCHDTDGTGMGEVPLNLVDLKWHHGGTLTEIEKTIGQGVPGTKMKPQQEKLSALQIADLAKYVLLLAKKKHGETAEPQRPAASKLTDQVAARSPPSKQAPVTEYENFIDQHIFGKMKADGIPHAGRCTDTEFVRRIHLDLSGRLPNADDVRQFLEDTDPEKRNKLIDQLLGLDYAHNPQDGQFQAPWNVGEAFLSKWRYFFEDLFRNYNECSLDIEAFRNYIYGFLKSNVPYDVVVREMLTVSTVNHETSGAAGFLVRQAAFTGGHEDTCDQNAMYATRNFLGVNLQCISCHDGADRLANINLWLSGKRRLDFWRQAAFFGDTRIVRLGAGGQRYYLVFDGRLNKPGPADEPTSRQEAAFPLAQYEFAPFETDSIRTEYRMDAVSTLRVPRDKNAEVVPAFILDERHPDPAANPRHELARMITESFQFAKVTVNLIWAQFMTVGIVDPPLDWDLARQDPANPPPEPWTLQPSHPGLLDALAKDFQEHGFDLRHLMRTICRSKAYQLSSRFDGEYKPGYDRYYARKLTRRLWAQEIYDAVLKATTLEVAEKDFAMNSNGPLRDVLPGHDIDISRFLNTFGQSNRDTKDADTRGGSVLQAATLLNSTVVKTKVLAGNKASRVNKLLQDHPPWNWREDGQDHKNQIIEGLFLSTLSRFPTDEEMQVSLEHLGRRRDIGVENLQWALLNKLEFIVNR